MLAKKKVCTPYTEGGCVGGINLFINPANQNSNQLSEFTSMAETSPRSTARELGNAFRREAGADYLCGSAGYVVCVEGNEEGLSRSCADACGGKCCTGTNTR